MNKYLILNFKSAKLFRKKNVNLNKKCKDISYTSYNNTNTDRKDIEPFVEDITVHQISNMLHVLFNERPVPSMRKVFYKRNEDIFNLAQESYLKIDTPVFKRENKKEKSEYFDFYNEFIQTKKAKWNSFSIVALNWKIVEEYISDLNKFDMFVNYLNNILDMNVTSLPFMKIIEMVQDLHKDERLKIYEVIKNMKKIDGLIYVFGQFKDGKFGKIDPSKITSAPGRSYKTITNGVDKYSSLNGQIIIPINNEMIEILENNSKGCATILDGGFVWIDSIKNANNIPNLDDEYSGFIKVCNISDERMKFLKE